MAVTRCKSRLTIVETTSQTDYSNPSDDLVEANKAVKCAFNWMRRLGVAHHHPSATSARIGRRNGVVPEHSADAVLFGSDESAMQHVADGCTIMRRVVESEEEEVDTLRQWVDNAVREFKVGQRKDLADAAQTHLAVVLARRKAAGESYPRTYTRHSITQTDRSYGHA